MQTNLRNCGWCDQEFHPTTHIPRILHSCGHTFCSQCLQGILNEGKSCPIDSIKTPDVKVEQLEIDSRILAAFPAPPDLCEIHAKPQDLIYLGEYRKICIDCKKQFGYKRHNLRSLGEVDKKADEKKKILQNFVAGSDTEYEEIVTLLNEKGEAMLKEVDNNFEFFKAEMEVTKNCIRSAVTEYYKAQRNIAEESHDRDVQLKNDANDLVQILDQKSHDQSYFNAFHTDIDEFKVSSQKSKFNASINVLENHVEEMKVGLMATLLRISLLRNWNPLGELQAEQNEIHNQREVLNNNNQDFMEEKEEEVEQQQQRMPRMETEEDYLQAASLFHAEIEENDRLILSFKNHQIETENILNFDLEKLKAINRVTLKIKKSQKWKEAIESLPQIWNKLDKVLDLKIDFLKTQAKEILEALVEQNKIWASPDLQEFAIDLSSSPVEDEHVIQLYEKAISNMVNVQKLEIVLEGTKITDPSVKVFAEKTLPNLANLTDFRFYVDYTKISDEAMEILLAGIHNKKINLTGLALGLDDTAMTNKTIDNIGKSISPLASGLRKFDLSMNNVNISDDGLKMLSDLQVNKVQEFALDLGRTQVSNKGLEVFGTNTLPKMTSLEVFELFLNGRKTITNKIVNLIAKGLESSSNLKKICLELGGTGIIGKILEQFTFRNYPVLDSFELYIAETEIKNVDLKAFLGRFGKDRVFQNLKTLSFCFSQLNLTENSCELLAKSIQQCANNLQILQLTLGKNEITDKGLDYLSNGINQVLQKTKLTEFQLYLDSTKVTDQGLKVFSEQVVRSLAGVKSFELYLILLPGVTDHGVEALFTELATVAWSLKKINISLYETGITNDSLKVLSETLWNAKPKLESFALSIGKNENITDVGLRWLFTNSEPILHSLKSLMLNVEKTGVSDEGIKILNQYLQEAPNALEKLEIEAGEISKWFQDLENYLL